MTESEASVDRGLGRVEARVADLTEQIAALRKELSTLVHTMESAIAAHRERIAALEAFRRWVIGLMTGLFLSGVAAIADYIFRS